MLLQAILLGLVAMLEMLSICSVQVCCQDHWLWVLLTGIVLGDGNRCYFRCNIRISIYGELSQSVLVFH